MLEEGKILEILKATGESTEYGFTGIRILTSSWQEERISLEEFSTFIEIAINENKPNILKEYLEYINFDSSVKNIKCLDHFVSHHPMGTLYKEKKL